MDDAISLAYMFKPKPLGSAKNSALTSSFGESRKVVNVATTSMTDFVSSNSRNKTQGVPIRKLTFVELKDRRERGLVTIVMTNS